MGFTLRPATGADFVDRDELIREMVQGLSAEDGTIGFALYGRRRIGKTSILREVARRLDHETNIVPVYFSVWDLIEETLAEFSQSLATTVLDAYRSELGVRHRAKQLLQTSREVLRNLLRDLKLSIRLQEEIEFMLSLQSEDGEAKADLLERVFHLADGLARETNTRCVLMLDEFPSMMELKNGSGEAAVRKVRTLQEDLSHTVLCISGSIRRTMEATVLTSGAAFYGQFTLREVGPLGRADVGALLQRNLRAHLAPAAAERLYVFTEGIPLYVQMLGQKLQLLDRSEISETDVNRATTQFLQEEGDLLFREEFNALSSKERLFVVAMSTQHVESPSGLASATDQTPNTVSRYLSYLQDKGVVRRVERGIYRFEDPVFARWLRERYG